MCPQKSDMMAHYSLESNSHSQLFMSVQGSELRFPHFHSKHFTRGPSSQPKSIFLGDHWPFVYFFGNMSVRALCPLPHPDFCSCSCCCLEVFCLFVFKYCFGMIYVMLCGYPACMHICAPRVCLVPKEARGFSGVTNGCKPLCGSPGRSVSALNH